MIHPYRLPTFTSSEWTASCFCLLENVSYKRDASVTFQAESPKHKKIRIKMILEAFWSSDIFKEGEEVLLLVSSGSSPPPGELQAALIASSAFCEGFARGKNGLVDVRRIRDLLKLPPSAQMLTCGFFDRKSVFPQHDFKENYTDLSHVGLPRLFNLIQPTLEIEARTTVSGWLENPGKNHNARKADLFLGIAPASMYRKEVTYDSILTQLHNKFVGYHDLKHTLATVLSQRQAEDRRGLVILLHGLPGTGKTALARTIASALALPLKFVSLNGVSSTLTLVGCESSYSESAPGQLVTFFRAMGTSETVVLFNEADKVSYRSSDKDSNIAELLLDILDPETPVLRDAYLDGVPIQCSNTLFVLTANRIDSLPAELINRCQLVLEVPPIEENDLLEVLERETATLANKMRLKKNWIEQAALREILRFRSDFGCRDALAHLRMLALSVSDKQQTLDASWVRAELTRRVDINAAVRFHMHEQLYFPNQRKAILTAFGQRQGRTNLSDQEKRALDARLNYLTKLIPDEELHTFSPDSFHKAAASLFGMKKPKDTLAAALYSASLSGKVSAPILLHGPAGVGKTSLVEAIAQATGRKYIRIQMNGVADPETLVGYPPEKVAADAGLIIRGLTDVTSVSPVIYFDEIDKIGRDVAMALLTLFDDTRLLHDQFVGCNIDLSHALLVASANDLSHMDPLLLSRFKTIPINGYSASEKRLIAQNHILPAILNGTGITLEPAAFEKVFRRYETDAGVRPMKHGFERLVESHRLNHRNSSDSHIIRVEEVTEVLGPEPYVYRADEHPGCVNALAVRGASKGVVMPVTVRRLANGHRRISGLPEAAVRDSIAIAETYVEQCGYSLDTGFHIHFSPGSVHKDGSSAGFAIAIAFYSAMVDMNVPPVGFTGEFDGKHILPVGGISLKVQAAESAGLTAVYLPRANQKDIDVSKFKIEIFFVETIDEVVELLFKGRMMTRPV